MSEQLFAEEPTVIELGVDPLGEQVEVLISELHGVRESSGKTICSKFMRRRCHARVARKSGELQLSLRHLTRKQYGLDEIYHRYFEGGEPA